MTLANNVSADFFYAIECDYAKSKKRLEKVGTVEDRDTSLESNIDEEGKLIIEIYYEVERDDRTKDVSCSHQDGPTIRNAIENSIDKLLDKNPDAEICNIYVRYFEDQDSEAQIIAIPEEMYVKKS